MALACIGLGSNIEPRLFYLIQARNELSRIHNSRILSTASLYESEPWGIKDQKQFFNSALLLETGHSPTALLDRVKKIERDLGREPSGQWEPRTIDLDILFYDDLVMRSDKLTLPHPLMTDRSFAVVPATEIFPDWVHPELSLSLHDLAGTNEFTTAVWKIDSSRWAATSDEQG